MYANRITITVTTILLVVAPIFGGDADSILIKMDSVMYSSNDMSGKTKIILIDKNGTEKTR